MFIDVFEKRFEMLNGLYKLVNLLLIRDIHMKNIGECLIIITIKNKIILLKPLF